jgi:hypothetical protein
MQLASDDTLNQKIWTELVKMPGLRAFFRVTQPTDLTDADIQKARKYDIPIKYSDGDSIPRQTVMRKVLEKESEANSEKQLNDIHQDVLIQQVRSKEISKDDVNKWIDHLENKNERVRLKTRMIEKYNFYRSKSFEGKKESAK